MLSPSPRSACSPHMNYILNDHRIYMKLFECKECSMNNFARTDSGQGNQEAVVTVVIPEPFLL